MSTKSLNEQVFTFLEGKWLVERTFEGSYQGKFKGEAIFTPDSDTPAVYDYTEQGQLTDDEGQRFDAKQNYLYRLTQNKVQVLKREESEWIVMHDLDFSMEEGVATASHVHLCGQDHYAVNIQIDLSGRWKVSYVVNGPKKDYRIRSAYVIA